MQDAIGYAMLFHAVAVIELFAVAAFLALRPAARHTRINWIAEPLPAQVKPDDSHWDYAQSYDEAA